MSMEMVKVESTQAELVQEKRSAGELLAAIEALAVDDQGDLELASEALAKVKGEWKRLEAKKKSATDPITKSLNEIRSWFKPAQEFYEKAEVLLKQKIAGYHKAVDERNAAAMLAAAEAFQAADSAGIQQALSTVVTAEKVSGLSIRETWDYEIENASLVPDQFVVRMIDGNALKEWIKQASGEPKPIPGIRFVKKQIVASRSK